MRKMQYMQNSPYLVDYKTQHNCISAQKQRVQQKQLKNTSFNWNISRTWQKSFFELDNGLSWTVIRLLSPHKEVEMLPK